MEWIRISDKLPEKNGFYLVTIKCDNKFMKRRNQIKIALWNNEINRFEEDGIHLLHYETIIAWKNLPEPYEGKLK